MPEVLDIRDHLFSSSDRLFFDANIWLYIYGPLACSHPGLQSVYSRALDRMLRAACPIYLDAIVLSEYANRFVRVEKEAGGYGDMDFKVYRGTDHYRDVAEAVADSIKRIDVLCNHCDSGFEDADVYEMMDRFREESRDLNDLMIEHTCRTGGLTPVTHDGDFAGAPIRIVSANRVLINP
jgi:predicted nucleic acid-binding protein